MNTFFIRTPFTRFAAIAAVLATSVVTGAVSGPIDVAAATSPTVLSTSATNLTTQLTPDESRLVYVDGSDLNVYDFASRTSTLLATDAEVFDPNVDRFGFFDYVDPVIAYDDWVVYLADSGSGRTTKVVSIDGAIGAVDLGGIHSVHGFFGGRFVVSEFSPFTSTAPIDTFSVLPDGTSRITIRAAWDPVADDFLHATSQYVVYDSGNVALVSGGSVTNVLPTGKSFDAVGVTAGGPVFAYGDLNGDESGTISGSPPVLQKIRDLRDPAWTPASLTTTTTWRTRPALYLGGPTDGFLNSFLSLNAEPLDGAGTWSADLTALPGDVGVFDIEAALFGQDLTFGLDGDTPADSALYHMDLTGSIGPVVPTVVPGTEGIGDGDHLFDLALYRRRTRPDGRVLFEGAISGSGASLQRDFLLWTPGAATSEKLTVSFDAFIDPNTSQPDGTLGWTLTNGTRTNPGDDGNGANFWADGPELLVTGADGALRRVDVGSSFGVPEVIDPAAGIVIKAWRAGDQLAYFTTDDPTSDCQVPIWIECSGTLKIVDDAAPSGGAGVSMLAAPERLMDTRPSGETDGDIAEKEGKLGSSTNNPFGNGAYRLPVAGRVGIANDAAAAVLNVTVVQPDGGGFVSVFPCNGPSPTPPDASSLNYAATTRAVANNVNVGLSNGDVCIFSSQPAHILVDVAGFYPAGSAFTPVTPERFVDTRPGADPATVVVGGIVNGGPSLGLSTIEVDVAGNGSVPSDASAVSMNIGAVNATAGGFATAYPCDQPVPATSSLNFQSGINIANGILVGIAQTGDAATDGKVCVLTNVATNLIVDVNGYFPAGAAFSASQPFRLLDTRAAGTTVDGLAQADGERMAGGELTLQLAGRPGVPVGADAVAINVTAVRSNAEQPTGFTGSGFVSATPGACTGATPTTSTLNVELGVNARANGAIVDLPPSGDICLYASRDMHLLVDVTGYFPT